MRCAARMSLVSEMTEPDEWIGWDAANESPIVKMGRTIGLWQTCSKRKGHRGDHGRGWWWW